MRKKTTILALAVMLSAPLSLPARSGKLKPRDDVSMIGKRKVSKGPNFYSIQKEIALGKQLAAAVEHSAKIVKDPVVAEYINRLGQNLVRHSDAKVPFTFEVIDSPEINAFSLPGGFCFVNTGLILKADTEAELAGVLAHEIAHVAARHGTRQATKSTIANLATIPLVIATGGWTGYGVEQAAGMAIPVAFLKFSRGYEREADYLGLQYMYAAGYDPTAFIDFFEKLAAQEKARPGTVAKIFSSHPMTDDRIQAAQKEMNTILPSRPEYVVNTSEFLKVKARLAALLSSRKLSPRIADRPHVRRSHKEGVILPEPKPFPGEDSDKPPVLKRNPKDEDQPPVLKRNPK